MFAVPFISPRLTTVFVAAALLFGALPASAAILTVGAAGSGCDHITIQAAVNAAQANTGADTIRVSRSAAWTAQAINITTDDELTLIGGYATCGSVSPDGTKTIVSGAGGSAAPVITIRGNGTIFLRELVIKEGDNPSGQGGGIDWRSGGILDIGDSAIVNNVAGYGGGIYAQGSNTISEVVVGDNATIGFNTARFNGGGVLAAGLEFSVRGVNTSVLFNEALGVSGDSGYGGGALVISTDDLSSYLYISAGGIGGLGAIYGNVAKHGGGIAVIGAEESAHDARLRVFTTSAGAAARINDNIASERGGAVYLKPDGDLTAGNAYVTSDFWNVFVTGNQAADGAAFYLDFDRSSLGGNIVTGSQLDVNPLTDYFLGTPPPPSALPCPDNAPCGAIAGNVATQAEGAVVRVAESFFSVRRAMIQDNQGTRLFDSNSSSRMDIFNCLITGNVLTQHVLRSLGTTLGGAFSGLRHVTVADNVIGASSVLLTDEIVELVNTLIWQPGKQTLAAGADDVTARYVITNDLSNLGAGAIIAAPRFVDPARGDYRLRAGSRGVDYAEFDSDFPLSSRETLDGSSHTVNVPNTGNGNPGIADVGAYERPALQPLVLNADFDSDLNLWDGLSDSFWDGTQNASGPAGSGSVRIPLIISPEGPTAPQAAGRSQCIHLPGPGIYTLNGFGRVTPSSNPPLTSNRARLLWELRPSDSATGCGQGAVSQSGILNLASTSSWATAPSPAQISLGTVAWTHNSSLTVKLDVIGSPASPPTAWFDGIHVDLISEFIFSNGFE